MEACAKLSWWLSLFSDIQGLFLWLWQKIQFIIDFIVFLWFCWGKKRRWRHIQGHFQIPQNCYGLILFFSNALTLWGCCLRPLQPLSNMSLCVCFCPTQGARKGETLESWMDIIKNMRLYVLVYAWKYVSLCVWVCVCVSAWVCLCLFNHELACLHLTLHEGALFICSLQ